jgi:hypothetical protein
MRDLALAAVRERGTGASERREPGDWIPYARVPLWLIEPLDFGPEGPLPSFYLAPTVMDRR